LAQSHIKLTGGIGDGKVIQNTISQVTHGFSVGQAIRYNRIAATGTGTNKYEAALADSPENSEVVGIVTQVLGDSSFVLTYAGEVDITSFEGDYALTDDDVFFLSDETPGLLTNTPPSDAGSVIKPVLVRTDGTRAIVTNYVGTVIGGTSTVSLNGIQPVGTIEPFAGLASSVPETWSLCDGGALSIQDYPDLFTQIGKAFGYQIKVEGTFADGSSIGDVQVGHYVEFREGNAVRLSGRVSEVPGAYFVVDVNYLEIVNDVYVQHNETAPSGPGSNVVIPTSDTNTLNYYGSIVTPVGEPSPQIKLTNITLTTLNFRKPDLRGKFVLGAADANTGTAIETPNAIVRGEIGGQYVATTGSGIVGTITTGGSDSISTIPPYQGLNWIIKTSSLGKAALLDNLTANFKLSDLLDVNAPPATAQSGQILIYDAASPIGERYRPYRLFLDFPEDAGNVFQIDNLGDKPLIKFGDSSLTSAFGINLDGLGNESSPEFAITSNTNKIFTVRASENDNGIIGIGALPSSGVNLTIGNKGLKFSGGATVNNIRTTVRATATATHDALVTEQGIREAITSAINAIPDPADPTVIELLSTLTSTATNSSNGSPQSNNISVGQLFYWNTSGTYILPSSGTYFVVYMYGGSGARFRGIGIYSGGSSFLRESNTSGNYSTGFGIRLS